MAVNSPRALHEFKDIYQSYIERNRGALTSAYWYTKPYRRDFSSKTEDFKLMQSTAEGILEGLEIALSDQYLGSERDKPGVQPYINYIVETIEIHLSKVAKYYDKNEPSSFKKNEDKREELKFQQLVFKGEQKIRSALRELNIDNDMSSERIDFHTGKLASLVFKKTLSKYSGKIKAKIESLDLDWDYMGDKRFFIHIPKREVPDWNESKHFWDQEKETLQFYIGEWNKIEKGFYVGDYFVHPWLYFHINFFKTNIPGLNDRGVIEEQVRNVDFRRTEWYFAEILKRAEELSRGAIFIYGSRRIGKSVFEASKLAHKSLISNDAELVVTINNDDDRISITDKIKTCFDHLPAFLSVETNKDDWSKLVEVGLKTKSNKKIKHCNIRITNLADGSKKASQKGAGGAPVEYVFDESGKSEFIDAYNAAKYSFKTPLGWKTIPVFVGCVVEGTKVWTNKGEIKNIENLKKEDGILGYNGHTVTQEPILYQKNPFEKECVKITTVGGHEIECSIDHPFLMSRPKMRLGGNVRNTTFEEAKDLNIGDYIYKPEKIRLFGDTKLDNPRMLGLLIGDGYYAGNSVSLSLAEEELFCYVNSKYNISIKKEFLTKDKKLYREVVVKGLSKWKKSLGIQNDSKDKKKIPSIMYQTSENNVCEFIAGYFDADGHVSSNKDGISIKLTSNYRHLLEDVQNLLHKIGIQSNIQKLKRDVAKLGEEYSNSQPFKFILDISRHRDIVKFSEKIYLIIDSKRERILDYVSSKKVNRDLSYLKKGKFKQNPDYTTQEWRDEVSNMAQYTIKSIEYTGRKPVYNLTAGKTNTYLANGFITHNTGSNVDISQDAEKVLSDPEKYDFIEIDWDILEYKIPKEHITWQRRKFGWFVPAQISYEEGLKFKKMKFSDFIGVESDILDKVVFVDADWEHNTKLLRDNQKKLLQTDRKEYQAYCVFLPTDPEHCFMSAKNNPYRPQLIKKHRMALQQEGSFEYGLGKLIRLQRDKQDYSKITYYQVSERVSTFPHRGGFIDAPGILYEDFPKIRPYDPYRYVGGLDDYKHEESDGDSVGAFFIYDRLTDKIVYELVTRPDPHSNFHKEMHMALDAWNAKCYMENADMAFKIYLERVSDPNLYLYKGFDAYGDLSYLSSGKRGFGWPPDKKTVPRMMGFGIDFAKEDVDRADDKGNITHTIHGFERIPSVQLLMEMERYKEGGNFDRIVAFNSCIAIDFYLNTQWLMPTKPMPKDLMEKPEEERPKFKKRRGFFSSSKRTWHTK